ncbi:MAG TPA: palindromic element RPE4 domain-containing protein [Rickettsia endosymbiont of Degeeriella rufa]|nr:palindromic element RPE4 domain-containing protein [Rickettsia endosymbiont of Degeeriella rufa]
METRSSYKKYKHEKLDFSRFFLDLVPKPRDNTKVAFPCNDGKDPYFTNTKSLFNESLELYL